MGSAGWFICYLEWLTCHATRAAGSLPRCHLHSQARSLGWEGWPWSSSGAGPHTAYVWSLLGPYTWVPRGSIPRANVIRGSGWSCKTMWPGCGCLWPSPLSPSTSYAGHQGHSDSKGGNKSLPLYGRKTKITVSFNWPHQRHQRVLRKKLTKSKEQETWP